MSKDCSTPGVFLQIKLWESGVAFIVLECINYIRTF